MREDYGIPVETKVTVGGAVTFDTPGGAVTAHVYKGRSPDVALNGVAVTLLGEWDIEPARYRIMVDDPWWGRRIQPAEFAEAPFTEHATMGYRLEARVLHDGVPQNGEGLSLELTWETAEDGEVVGWFPDAFNELVWSQQLQTYVSGPELVWPIVTRHEPQRDEDGWAAFDWPGLRTEDAILPKGHGSIFQRAGDELYDGWLEEPDRELLRYVTKAEWVYRGYRKPAVEGEPAVFDVGPATVTFRGQPGAWYEFGHFDRFNPPTGGGILDGNGEAVRQLQPTEHWAWQWDDGVGIGDRVGFTLEPGEQRLVTLPAMRTQGVLVYTGGAEPAAGVTVYKGNTTIPLGTTDQNGYLDTTETVLSVNDPDWGYQHQGTAHGGVICLALGGRIVTQRVLVWRTPAGDHPNFKHVPQACFVRRQDDGQVYPMVEAAGEWWSYISQSRVPRNSPAEAIPSPDPEVYVWDPGSVTFYTYEWVRAGDEDVLAQCQLQPLDCWQPTGSYEILIGPSMGGKVKGNLLRRADEQVEGTDAPFKLIEFGRHRWFLEQRQVDEESGEQATCFCDLLCPYCGGRAWVEPDEAPYERGFCQYCTATWGVPQKTDCRTYFEGRTVWATA